MALLTSMALLTLLTGCGNTVYLLAMDTAEGRLEEAQSVDAERHAPYEYYSAQARITEAKRQAAEAEYGAAAELADEASKFAASATKKTQAARLRGKQ
jgi:hypothetical protein